MYYRASIEQRHLIVTRLKTSLLISILKWDENKYSVSSLFRSVIILTLQNFLSILSTAFCEHWHNSTAHPINAGPQVLPLPIMTTGLALPIMTTGLALPIMTTGLALPIMTTCLPLPIMTTGLAPAYNDHRSRPCL